MKKVKPQIKSMTGYGRGEACSGGMKAEAELSSVNRRQFDLRLNLPDNMYFMEHRLRDLVHSTIKRGYVAGSVKLSYVKGSAPGKVDVNAELAEAYVKTMRRAARKLDLHDDLSAGMLARIQGVVVCRDERDDSEKVWRLVKKAVKTALGNLSEMRGTEGDALRTDINRRIERLRAFLEKVKKLSPGITSRYRTSLKKRLGNAGIDPRDCPDSVAREIALFAERCDISEETVRLDSHFNHAEKLMNSGKPAGRALDFVCQEMFREINTIGSKANSAAVSGIVIDFKTELECVREQVQNVE